jgi:hypothetical protein
MEEADKRVCSRAENELNEQSKRYANKFLKNLKGIVFYAVPHVTFMENLKPNQSRMESLCTTFDSIMNGFRVKLYVFIEGIPTKHVVSSE